MENQSHPFTHEVYKVSEINYLINKRELGSLPFPYCSLLRQRYM